MKKGKYLILGLFPLAVSGALLSTTQGADKDPSKDEEIFYNASNPAEDTVNQLVLSNASISEVVGILEKLTGKTALFEQKLPQNKISIEVQESINRLEAIGAIESVLSLNGIAVVDMGSKFMKIVTSRSAISQSPDIIDDSLLNFEPSQKVCSKFFKLKYVDASEFQKLIRPILTTTSNVVPFVGSNSLFITDTMANLQRVENLMLRVDTPINMVEDVSFIPLNNVKASAIVKKFEQLKRGSLKKYLGYTTIDSDDSSNQLIVITPKENFSTIQKIAEQLDNKCELLLKSEVLRIKHGDAQKITEIVNNLVKEQRSRAEKENQMSFERQQAQMNAQGSLANALAQAASGSRTNQQISNTYSDFISSQQILQNGDLADTQTAQFSANLTLSCDERSNSIIVYGTATDLAQVKSIINNIDVLLDQVRIEVIIAQVTLTEGQQSGLESLNLGFNQDKTYSAVVDSGDTKKRFEINADWKMANGSSFQGTLKNFALASVFNQAKSNSNVKILSTPTIVTTHNRKAEIKIGENRPFAESSVSDDTSGSKTKTNINYKHVGIELTVTPLIGSNGIIQLEINQEVSKYDGDADVGGSKSPIISDKRVTSFVSVADRDVIVMAGFQERTSTKSGGKTFLLGDIPVLGDTLFSSKKRNEEVRELIIFIKPTIILHPQDEAAYLNKRLETTNFKDDIDNYRNNGEFIKPQPFPSDTIIGLNAENSGSTTGSKRTSHSRAHRKVRRNSPQKTQCCDIAALPKKNEN